jgi:hypothetical protein
MNLRTKLLTLPTSGLLSRAVLGTVLGLAVSAGCNSREELAPWFAQEIAIMCATAPEATVGQPFRWELKPSGGVGELSVRGDRPPARPDDRPGRRHLGTPTMDGNFDQLVITVTDAEGNVSVFDACGGITVDKPDAPSIECVDASGSIPDGFVGVGYPDYKVNAPGGAVPYEWSVTGLPPGLMLTPTATRPPPRRSPAPRRPRACTTSRSPSPMPTARRSARSAVS